MCVGVCLCWFISEELRCHKLDTSSFPKMYTVCKLIFIIQCAVVLFFCVVVGYFRHKFVSIRFDSFNLQCKSLARPAIPVSCFGVKIDDLMLISAIHCLINFLFCFREKKRLEIGLYSFKICSVAYYNKCEMHS